jgi:hypothetical protein
MLKPTVSYSPAGPTDLNMPYFLFYMLGRAIAQAVSRWLPIAAARVRSRVWWSGICGGQSGAGAGFLRVLRFPLPVFIPTIAPQSPSPIIWGWYNRPEVAAVQGTYKGIRHVETCLDILFTARVHTTKSTVKILAANTHSKYFLRNYSAVKYNWSG